MEHPRRPEIFSPKYGAWPQFSLHFDGKGCIIMHTSRADGSSEKNGSRRILSRIRSAARRGETVVVLIGESAAFEGGGRRVLHGESKIGRSKSE